MEWPACPEESLSKWFSIFIFSCCVSCFIYFIFMITSCLIGLLLDYILLAVVDIDAFGRPADAYALQIVEAAVGGGGGVLGVECGKAGSATEPPEQVFTVEEQFHTLSGGHGGGCNSG